LHKQANDFLWVCANYVWGNERPRRSLSPLSNITILLDKITFQKLQAFTILCLTPNHQHFSFFPLDYGLCPLPQPSLPCCLSFVYPCIFHGIKFGRFTLFQQDSTICFNTSNHKIERSLNVIIFIYHLKPNLAIVSYRWLKVVLHSKIERNILALQVVPCWMILIRLIRGRNKKKRV
jgi:hypothetical protein